MPLRSSLGPKCACKRGSKWNRWDGRAVCFDVIFWRAPAFPRTHRPTMSEWCVYVCVSNSCVKAWQCFGQHQLWSMNQLLSGQILFTFCKTIFLTAFWFPGVVACFTSCVWSSVMAVWPTLGGLHLLSKDGIYYLYTEVCYLKLMWFFFGAAKNYVWSKRMNLQPAANLAA